MTAWMAVPPPVLMSPSNPGIRGVTTYTLYLFPSLIDTEREIRSVKEVKLLPSSSVCVLPVSFDDPLGNGISDLVENVSVVGTADEELILDVDVVLAVSDDFNVGVVDGLFMVLDASGPV